MSEVQWYHGTRRGFSRGGWLIPQAEHKGEQRPGAQPDGDQFIYVTPDYDQAMFYAVNTKGRGRPKVLTLDRFTQPLVPDDSPYDYEQRVQWRCGGWARVAHVEIITDDPR